jgi:uncharacterized membrane protein YeaQ/YmgE (transglycosylase-associated protein family)
MAVIVWFLLGMTVGLAAHRLLPGSTPGGLAGSLVAGVLGAVLAGVAFAIATGQGLGSFAALGLLAATAGAVVVVGLLRMASGTTSRRIRSMR